MVTVFQLIRKDKLCNNTVAKMNRLIQLDMYNTLNTLRMVAKVTFMQEE